MGQAAIWIKYINAWFPDFLLSSFHLFPPLPWFPILPPILIPSVVKNASVDLTNLTTDCTDTIWIKFKRPMLGFPIFYFPDFIFSRHRPDLKLKLSTSTGAPAPFWFIFT